MEGHYTAVNAQEEDWPQSTPRTQRGRECEAPAEQRSALDFNLQKWTSCDLRESNESCALLGTHGVRTLHSFSPCSL